MCFLLLLPLLRHYRRRRRPHHQHNCCFCYARGGSGGGFITIIRSSTTATTLMTTRTNTINVVISIPFLLPLLFLLFLMMSTVLLLGARHELKWMLSEGKVDCVPRGETSQKSCCKQALRPVCWNYVSEWWSRKAFLHSSWMRQQTMLLVLPGRHALMRPSS